MKTRADSLHAQGKEHDFLLDAPGGSHFNAKSDRLLGNSVNVQALRKVPHAEAKEELGLCSGKRMTTQVVALVVVCRLLSCCTPG